MNRAETVFAPAALPASTRVFAGFGLQRAIPYGELGRHICKALGQEAIQLRELHQRIGGEYTRLASNVARLVRSGVLLKDGEEGHYRYRVAAK